MSRNFEKAVLYVVLAPVIIFLILAVGYEIYLNSGGGEL